MKIEIVKNQTGKSKFDLVEFQKRAQIIFDTEVKEQKARALAKSKDSKASVKSNNPL
ncbi:MAG: hypothetical protein PHQ74_06270 [Crocinitomicaceae bacterium]|nr:hypothetical protein [Crocinitomicaceae bacterium]